MEDDYTTNSHYLTYTILFRKVGRMYLLSLGVKGLINSIMVVKQLEERDN